MASLDEIRQLFFVECDEQLEVLADGLGDLENDGVAGECPEAVNSMFRAVHSIKGGAASFGLSELTSYAHAFETVLDDLRSGRILIDPVLIRKLFRASDHLADLVGSAGADEVVDPTVLEKIISETLALGSGSQLTVGADIEEGSNFEPMALDWMSPNESPGISTKITFTALNGLFEVGHDPIHLFRELSELGSLDVVFEDREPGDVKLMTWHIAMSGDVPKSAIWEVFDFVDGLADIEIIQDKSLKLPSHCPIEENYPSSEAYVPLAEEHPRSTSRATKTTLRVDLDLVDSLNNLVGELVINQSVLSQSVAESQVLSTTRVDQALEELKTLSRQIQEGVMTLRAQSVKPLFQRMARIVRETAEIAGKGVVFETEGEATEVDRTVIEHLVDPLTHILRNSIDHGIETPEARAKIGKPMDGLLRLSAVHRSGRVFIEVSDDGAGIDRSKVLEKAIEQGLASRDSALSNAEIDRLLFAPGFSTAQAVTSLSGRGVGMDVVNREIQKLGGRISIASDPGRGTSIAISLPLTLAVLDGMVVDVSGQTMVVPISAIVETIRPAECQIHDLGVSARMVSVRNVMIPVVDLAVAFSFGSPSEIASHQVLLLVETEGKSLCALAVDRIYDQRQVVIKSLEGNYGRIPGIAAATILGDGKIALIVDADEIASLSGGAIDARRVSEVS